MLLHNCCKKLYLYNKNSNQLIKLDLPLPISVKDIKVSKRLNNIFIYTESNRFRIFKVQKINLNEDYDK